MYTDTVHVATSCVAKRCVEHDDEHTKPVCRMRAPARRTAARRAGGTYRPSYMSVVDRSMPTGQTICALQSSPRVARLSRHSYRSCGDGEWSRA